MTDIIDVEFGATSDGKQGDTSRAGFAKVNQNFHALNAGKAELGGADFTGDITTTGSLTVTKKATVRAGLDVTGSASFSQRPTYAGNTPYDSGNLDLSPYAKLSGGNFSVRPTFVGNTPWDSGNLPGSFANNVFTFATRPAFAGNAPWDAGNLKSPVDTATSAGALAGRTALGVGRVLISSQTFAYGAGVSAIGFDLSSTEFEDYELEFSGVKASGADAILLIQLGISGQSGYDNSNSYTSLYRYMGQPTATGSVSDSGYCFLAQPYFEFMTIASSSTGTGVANAANGGGSVKFRNMKNTSLYKMIAFEYAQVSSGGSLVSGEGHGFYFGGPSAINKMQIFLSAGNISGRFSLYGIKR